jgi:hypothetical protein
MLWALMRISIGDGNGRCRCVIGLGDDVHLGSGGTTKSDRQRHIVAHDASRGMRFSVGPLITKGSRVRYFVSSFAPPRTCANLRKLQRQPQLRNPVLISFVLRNLQSRSVALVWLAYPATKFLEILLDSEAG